MTNYYLEKEIKQQKIARSLEEWQINHCNLYELGVEFKKNDYVNAGKLIDNINQKL